jgi:hypothetical protein
MLDPKDPKTWVNNTLPVDEKLQGELTRVGGVVPDGAYAGQPIYKLAFGQTETEYLGGKQRIRFRDARIPRLAKVSRFFVSPEIATKVSDFYRDNPLVNEYGVFVERPTLREFIAKEPSFQSSTLETVTIPERDYRRFMHVPQFEAPATWLFLSEIEELISIGRECWYVMRWMAAEDYEKRASWDKNRFAYGVMVPEVGAEVPVLDFNGPYPEHGVYVPFSEIAEYEDESYRNYKFLQPDFSNTVQPVIETIEEGKLTDEQKAVRIWNDQVAVVDEHCREIDKSEEIWDQFQKDTAPLFAGKERVWANEPARYIHRDIKTRD